MRATRPRTSTQTDSLRCLCMFPRSSSVRAEPGSAVVGSWRSYADVAARTINAEPRAHVGGHPHYRSEGACAPSPDPPEARGGRGPIVGLLHDDDGAAHYMRARRGACRDRAFPTAVEREPTRDPGGRREVGRRKSSPLRQGHERNEGAKCLKTSQRSSERPRVQWSAVGDRSPPHQSFHSRSPPEQSLIHGARILRGRISARWRAPWVS
jgi:hypothetical protein